MSEPSPAPTPSVIPAPPRRAPFSNLVTAVCSIVAIVYVGLLSQPLIEPATSPLAPLERPADSLDRLVSRELDLRAAMRGGPDWEWRLHRMLSGDDDPIEQAGRWYEEMVEVTGSPTARLHRAILLAEAGRADDAREAVAHLTTAGEDGRRMAGWVMGAYLDPPPTPQGGRALLEEIDAELPGTWFSDTLTMRLAARIGDAGARARAEAAIAARGRELLVRARAVMATAAALLGAGALALAWLLARRAGSAVADAPLPPVWSGAEGYALFVRGLAAPQIISLLLVVVLREEQGIGAGLGMAADLPLFWWVMRYLRTRDSSMHAAFGLAPPRDGRAPLVAVTLALIAAGIVADPVIHVASGFLDLQPHWTDGFTEELLWASRRQVILAAVDAIVWAPVVEELTFRGLLYATLRTRLGPGASAALSAIVFTFPHGYAISGSASVLVSGLLWALAYERTRSLWPGLLAHSANNLLATLWTVALLR